MMILSRLIRRDGRAMGTKAIPDDCLAVKYGGALFVRVGGVLTDPLPSAIYQMTDTYHFNDLDQE